MGLFSRRWKRSAGESGHQLLSVLSARSSWFGFFFFFEKPAHYIIGRPESTTTQTPLEPSSRDTCPATNARRASQKRQLQVSP
jgi:hypothetical protein